MSDERPLRTFKAQSFAEVLAEAQSLPGVDPNDPEIAPLLAELSKDPGFVMIGFPAAGALGAPDPSAQTSAQAVGFGPPPGWTPPEPTTIKVGDQVRWWPFGRPPARQRASAAGVVEAVSEDGLFIDFRRKDGALFSNMWADSCQLVKAAKPSAGRAPLD